MFDDNLLREADAFTTATLETLMAWARQRGTVQCVFVRQLLDTVRTRQELVRAMDTLARKMTATAQRVNAGGGANSLGEVQRLGDDVDRLCAKLCAQREELGVWAQLLPVLPTD
jgi:hypothetical protein